MRWLRGHTKDVRAVAYTPDGRLISGGSDKTVRVWDPVQGTVLEAVKTPRVLYTLAVSPDGKTLAYAGRHVTRHEGANAVHFHDLQHGRPEGECVWPMPDYARSLWSLSFSADGNYLAAACRELGAGGIINGAGAHWWQRVPPRAEADLAPLDVYAVAFGHTDRSLAVTRRQLVTILDRPGGPERLSYPLQSDWAAAVAFVPSDRMVIVAANSFLYFFDPRTAARPQRIRTGIRVVTALAVSPDGKKLLVGGRPGTVEWYDLESCSHQTTYDFEIGGVHSIAFAPDGYTFALGGDRGLVVCDWE